MGKAIDSLLVHRQQSHTAFVGVDVGPPPDGVKVLDGNQFHGAVGLVNVDWSAGTTLEIQVWVYDGRLGDWFKLMLIDATQGLTAPDKYAFKVDVAGQTWGITVPTNDGTVDISIATVSREIGGS